MNVLVLSDLHSDLSLVRKLHENIPYNVDMLIVCGDLTHFGDFVEATKMLKALNELGMPILFVPGNCDPKELALTQSICGASNVHGRCKDVKGFHFLGIGGCPLGPFHTPFEMSEREIKQILGKAHSRSKMASQFILVTHTPPINTKVDTLNSGFHAGSQAIRDFVEMKKPYLVLCGHIHEARGQDRIDGTLVVNPGPAYMNLYAIINIDGGTKVNLDSLD